MIVLYWLQKADSDGVKRVKILDQRKRDAALQEGHLEKKRDS